MVLLGTVEGQLLRFLQIVGDLPEWSESQK